MQAQQKILEKLDRIEAHLKQAQKPLPFDEARAYLDVSASHLYKLTSKGEIPHFKPRGKRLYFMREDLNDFMRRGRVAAQAEIDAQAATHVTTN